ncbi:histone-lysine N-methyltransferase family member SUVH2 [Brassica rapa]|uniref:SET domain-containing protein n=1 Tax=Brassica campestris TaxID=3711 RepID=M4DZ93_BRACM|nr:histone-lysine N-methyltransferase family member SUVH2 [Brassica rapa]
MNTLFAFPELNRTPSAAAMMSLPPRLRVKAEPIDDPTPPPTPTPTPTPTLTPSDIYAEYYSLCERVASALANRNNDLLAIVPVPEEKPPLLHSPPPIPTPPGSGDNRALSSRLPPRFQRPHELARVADLGREDHIHRREILKRTRAIYDSLRLHIIAEAMRLPGRRRKPRADYNASTLMRERGLWLNQDKHVVGSIPGVEIGDMFLYRLELCVIGLHGQPQAGIDFLTANRSSNGEPIATSIIVSGGYEDDEDTGEVLVYSGHGGQDKVHRQCQHQRLESGNLAMERSMHYGIEVRVIRGFKYDNVVSSKVYVYDGLYRIVQYWFDVGRSGFGVFKFKLVRIEGQGEMGSRRMKFAQALRTKPLAVRPNGYITFNLSGGKENVPVYLYNDIDFDREPEGYDYIVRSAIPCVISARGGANRGCDCNYSCGSDCFCARRNGGELPYDDDGTLLKGKPVVFECGVLCGCGPSCKNRVTQKGLSKTLEVFRSRETGWGVRTLDFIQAGAFICEYAGVVLTREQAKIVSMSGDPLLYPGRFTEKWSSLGDLSQVYPEYVQPSYPSLPPVDFGMDVSKFRNVASYISHSKESNVMAQFVLHDHSNLMYPRVMLFALENISPLTELSLDYGLDDKLEERLAICN